MTTSPPHSSQLAGSLLSLISRKPHIVDFRDPWTDVSYIYKSTFRLGLESLMESLVVKKAEKVISSTTMYTQALRSKYHRLPPDRFETVTNSFEAEEFQRINAKENREFTVCYLGIFYPKLNPYCFFEALSQWLSDFPRARLNTVVKIVGNGDTATASVIERYGLSDVVTTTGRLTHKNAIKIAKSSDLLLLCTGTGKNTPRGWVPSKLYEYIACGKPILANVPEGEAASIIRKTRTGYVVPTDDSSKIVEILRTEYALKRILKSQETTTFNPNQPAIYKYTNDSTISKLVDIFDSICRIK